MRVIGLLLAFKMALAPVSVEAQAVSQKTFRVGYLTPSGQGPVRPWEADLGKLGYVEGRNLTIERRYADGKFERLPALASELVRLKVDVIVTVGGDAIVAAKSATATIPSVMAFGGAGLIESGIVANLGGEQRPGITGETIGHCGPATLSGEPPADTPSADAVAPV